MHKERVAELVAEELARISGEDTPTPEPPQPRPPARSLVPGETILVRRGELVARGGDAVEAVTIDEVRPTAGPVILYVTHPTIGRATGCGWRSRGTARSCSTPLTPTRSPRC